MPPTSSIRSLWAALLCLLGAVVAVFITGTQPTWAVAVFVGTAGAALLIGLPTSRPGWAPVLLVTVFCLLPAAAFLPFDVMSVPSWRGSFLPNQAYQLGNSISPQPWLGWFWWGLLVASAVICIFLLASPLEGRLLALFLHGVALAVAVYAILAVSDVQSAWEYPFRGKAPFGFLPNKNHTATMLVVGAIISFGLMQWEISRGSRAAAVSAALCGATPLAALLFFSNSRAGVVFLGFGLLVWTLGAARGRAQRSILVGALALVLFLAALFLFGGGEVRDRLARLTQEALAVEQEGVVGTVDLDFRQPIFRDTYGLIIEHPWAGTGLGQFRYVFPHYRNESVRPVRILHPESDWLMVAAESGIPAALVLLLLVAWYVQRAWRGRLGRDGLLHWTAASAILATVAHGLVDVPWHRPALGWFLMVVAAVSVPGSRLAIHHMSIARLLCVLAGVLLLAVAVAVGVEQREGRFFVNPYNWGSMSAELEKLGRAERYDEALLLSRKLVKTFPLDHEAHYWLLAFLRGTEEDIGGATARARRVEPILPQVAVGQALLWKGIDDALEAEAWVEAIKRSLAVDRHERASSRGSAEAMMQQAVSSLRGKPNAQRVVWEEFRYSPTLSARWLLHADADISDALLSGLPNAGAWIDGLPPALQERVLDRWVTLPSAAGAVDYMERRGGAGVYGRPLANYYAREGDKERAVRVMAEAEGVSLASRVMGGDFGGQLAGLEAQGNEVAVRRLLKEAVEAKEADRERLSVAVSWYAGAGDWEMAWRAASRLASTRKNGQ